MPPELTGKEKESIVLKCCPLVFYITTMNHFSIRLWRDKKWIWYDSWWQPAQGVAWEEAPEHFPKSSLHQKKVMVTVWCPAAHLIHYSFWIPAVKPLHLRSILSKSMRYTENCNACIWHSSTERTQRFSMTTPDSTSILQKLSKLDYEVLPYHLTSRQPTTTSSSIWQLFFQGKCFHNQQEAENTFQEFTESQSADFYVTGINELISCWQKCVDCNGSHSD